VSATKFCIAYREHIQKVHRSERAQPEPNPADYRMPPTRDPLTGTLVEHPLAEGLRREVQADFSRDVVRKAIERKR